MSKFILAIDQGTTQTTIVLLDPSAKIVGKESVEFEQIYPHAGWVEHCPNGIWSSVVQAIVKTLTNTGISGADIGGIGITNQRETTVVWDRSNGNPVHNAIVWQCRRTTDKCAELKAAGNEEIVRKKTGLVLDPYFSATKIRWILDRDPDLQTRAEKGELAFGTIDSFLVHRLSGGEAHVTDLTNASRTLLCNIHTAKWDDELLSIFQIPHKMMPSIVSSNEQVGVTKGIPGLPDGIPIAGIAGDQQAALFGQACFDIGDAKCTYGTGSFLMMNTGDKPVASNNGLLTTVGWKLDDKITYALEGSLFIAGAAVQWLRDGLGLIKEASEIEALAMEVPNSDGVFFVPALSGLGAPHWRPEARGVIGGLTRGSTRAHIARACLDGIAHQVVDILEAMQQDSDTPIKELKVDGGAAANNLLMQIQSNLLGVPIVRPVALETTAIGAGFLCGLATGAWTSQSQIAEVWRKDRHFTPDMSEEMREEEKQGWEKAVSKT